MPAVPFIDGILLPTPSNTRQQIPETGSGHPSFEQLLRDASASSGHSSDPPVERNRRESEPGDTVDSDQSGTKPNPDSADEQPKQVDRSEAGEPRGEDGEKENQKDSGREAGDAEAGERESRSRERGNEQSPRGEELPEHRLRSAPTRGESEKVETDSEESSGESASKKLTKESASKNMSNLTTAGGAGEEAALLAPGESRGRETAPPDEAGRKSAKEIKRLDAGKLKVEQALRLAEAASGEQAKPGKQLEAKAEAAAKAETDLPVPGEQRGSAAGRITEAMSAEHLEDGIDKSRKVAALAGRESGGEAAGSREEGRGTDSGDSKVRVVDLRSQRHSSRNDQGGSGGGEAGSRQLPAEAGEANVAEARPTGAVEQGEFAHRLEGTGGQGRGAEGTRVLHQEQLHRFLRDSGYQEIVRNARVMLREGGNGELRLNLSPKELGSVRIQLQLEDSHIAGRIIVENSTVREVFEQNLEQLQRAFQSQGLETGRLEVSVQERGAGQQGHRHRRGGGARVFEEHTARLPEQFYEDSRVNLMA
ncbi:MAG: flagellar hook-length control protein FliK [Spirochaetaceae bacterium]